MSDDSDPHCEAWSTVAWDGKNHLLAADLHFDRLERHAIRLGFNMPEDYRERIFKEKEKMLNKPFDYFSRKISKNIKEWNKSQ